LIESSFVAKAEKERKIVRLRERVSGENKYQ